MRILVIDEEFDVAKDRETYRNRGINLISIASVQAARLIYQDCDPHFIFIRLKDQDSNSLLREILKKSRAKVVVVKDEDFRIDFRRSNPFEVIEPPLDAATILMILSSEDQKHNVEAIEARDGNADGGKELTGSNKDVKFQWIKDLDRNFEGFERRATSFELEDNGHSKDADEEDEVSRGNANSKKRKQRSRESINIYQRRSSNLRKRFVRQEVISVFSCKGGVGKTSIAVSLCHLAGELDPLLIDLNFAEGSSDVAIILQLPKIPHLGKFISELGNNERALSDILVKPGMSSFSVIQPPPTLKQSDRFNIDHLAALLDEAKRQFGMVVLDLPCRYDDLTLMGLRMSSCVLLVAACDFGSAIRLKELVSMLDPDQRKILAVNICSQDVQLKPKDISNYLNIREAVLINYDSECHEYFSGNRLLPAGTVFGSGVEKLLNAIFRDETESSYYFGG
ncbi:MAG: AAA family ATPase [Actinobacteria bacterium]|nr:AAA family ATPase [Actinomycetota bacterium]